MPIPKKTTQSYTNYENILDVDMNNPTQLRLFMYDVDDCYYEDNFFSINNINPNKPQDLDKFLNVLDISDRLISRFAVARPDSSLRYKSPRPIPNVIYKGNYIIRDENGKKKIKEITKGDDGFPVRIYETRAIVPGIVMAKMQPIEVNFNGFPERKEVTSFMVGNRGTTEVRYTHEEQFGLNDYIGNVNPTSSFNIKKQVRYASKADISSNIREYISIKLVDLQREERDGNGNIIKPRIDAVWKDDILVDYNQKTKRLELHPQTYQAISNYASHIGASPKFNPVNAALLEMEAYLSNLGDNAGTADIALKTKEYLKELVRTGNTSKTLNEKGEEISTKK